jgi:hypothetical protein
MALVFGSDADKYKRVYGIHYIDRALIDQTR